MLGEATYGKGSVQSIIPLKNRGAIRLTVSKYYLPSGKSISEVGVIPDIRVEEEGEDFSINTEAANAYRVSVGIAAIPPLLRHLADISIWACMTPYCDGTTILPGNYLDLSIAQMIA